MTPAAGPAPASAALPSPPALAAPPTPATPPVHWPAVLARRPQQIGALQGSPLGQFIGMPLMAAVVVASGQWGSAGWVSIGAALLGVLLGLLAWRAEGRAGH